MIAQIERISLNKRETIREYAESGRRLCGYVSNFVPEEMIHASGMLPVMLGPPASANKIADSLFQTFVCDHVRGCLEAGLSGDYADLDCLIFTRTCDAIRNLYTVWINNVATDSSFYLSTPGNADEDAVAYFAEELEQFRKFLEKGKGSGTTGMTMDALSQSIALYNKNRRLLRSLSVSGRLSGSQMFHLYEAATITDPLELHTLLQKIDPEAIEVPDKPVKLIVTANHFSDPEIVANIENLGIRIVLLDLENGLRRIWNEVEENDDPLKALARRYVGNHLDPSKHPSLERIELLISLAGTVKADGIIVMNQKYCDTYLFEEPLLKETLEKNRIPSLFLTTGERLEQGQQQANRIQAFLEMIENQ